MSIINDYFDKLTAHLTQLRDSQAEAMAQAVAMIGEAARNDKRVFVFGTGHSHMLAEEVHYRAGGLAITVPVLSAFTMLHEGASSSGRSRFWRWKRSAARSPCPTARPTPSSPF